MSLTCSQLSVAIAVLLFQIMNIQKQQILVLIKVLYYMACRKNTTSLKPVGCLFFFGSHKSAYPTDIVRTFAPIATAHFFAHVTHTSCIADHEGKHDAKGAGANIFHKNGT